MAQHGGGPETNGEPTPPTGVPLPDPPTHRGPVAGPTPRVLIWAFAMWLLVVVLGAIATALTFANGHSVLVGNGPQGPGSLASGRGLVVVAVPLVWWAAEILAAFALRRGRAWARVLLTTLGTISLVLGLVGLPSDFGAAISAFEDGETRFALRAVLDLVLELAQATAIVVALLLIYRPASSSYLRRPTT